LPPKVEARGERLGAGDDVGFEAEAVDRPEVAGAADAGLHLVVDPQRADLGGVRLQAGEEVPRRRDEAAFAGDGLDHERRHLLLADAVLDLLLEGGQCSLAGLFLGLGAPRVAVVVRVLSPVDLRGARHHPRLVRMRLVGERQGHVGAAVEGVRERHDAGTLGVGAGDLDGVLDGLGAGVGQEGLLRGRAGSQGVEPLGQLDVGGVHADREAEMLELLDLALDGFDHARMRVAEVHDRDPRAEVQVALAVDVPDVRSLPANRMERVHADSGRGHGGSTTGCQVGVRHLQPPAHRLRSEGDELSARSYLRVFVSSTDDS